MNLHRRISLAAIRYFLTYRTGNAEAARRELFALCKMAIAPHRYPEEQPQQERRAA